MIHKIKPTIFSYNSGCTPLVFNFKDINSQIMLALFYNLNILLIQLNKYIELSLTWLDFI